MPTRPKNNRNTTLNGKARAVTNGGNGVSERKGKSTRWDSSDEEDDDDDEAYITSNDSQATPERGGKSGINASGFRTGNVKDEEEMYE